MQYRRVLYVEPLSHLNPWHSEGHWLNGSLGEHQPHSHLYLPHIALCFGKEDQALQTGTNHTCQSCSIMNTGQCNGSAKCSMNRSALDTLCGSGELKLLQSIKYGSSGTSS